MERNLIRSFATHSYDGSYSAELDRQEFEEDRIEKIRKAKRIQEEKDDREEYMDDYERE